LDGETYQSIAAAGGGIKYTVRQTRAASDAMLAEFCRERMRHFLAHGVTTVEGKSGYGLSVDDELRLLRIMRVVADETPVTLVRTCLALHAVMPEYSSTEAYVDLVIRELLPRVANEGLAEYVDAFVERGYFSVAQTQPYIEAAKRLGLKVRVHADEFADGGAALAAAEWGAYSADHVEHASDVGIAAMARNKTVAILLPGTSLYTAIPYARAERFRKAGCGIALATDFNPGSCQVDNLNFIATIGALHCGLRAAETIAAVTYVPAVSLGLGNRKGALANGHEADFSIYPMAQMEDWLADLGRRRPTRVFVGGQQVSGALKT
jgi:imidazolonepropionase